MSILQALLSFLSSKPLFDFTPFWAPRVSISEPPIRCGVRCQRDGEL